MNLAMLTNDPTGGFSDLNSCTETIRQEQPILLEKMKSIPLRVIESGKHNRILIIGSMVFRFPRTQSSDLVLEACILRQMNESSTVKLNFPLLKNDPVKEGYFQYELVPGENPDAIFFEMTDQQQKLFAEIFGEFCHAFHSEISVNMVREAGAKNKDKTIVSDLARLITKAQTAGKNTEAAYLNNLLASYQERSDTLRNNHVALHNNTHPGNLLTSSEEKQLTGIIDFGTVRIGNPAWEFVEINYIDANLGRAVVAAYNKRCYYHIDYDLVRLLTEIQNVREIERIGDGAQFDQWWKRDNIARLNQSIQAFFKEKDD